MSSDALQDGVVKQNSGGIRSSLLESSSDSPSKRNSSVDTLKFFGILAVIIIHTGPSYYSGPQALSWVRTMCGLAVPFFLTAAGFFLGKSLGKGPSIQTVYARYTKKLAVAFIGWSVIYSLPPITSDLWRSIGQYGLLKTYYWYYTETFQFTVPYLLLSGTAGHLWFLSSLMVSATLLSVFCFYKKEKLLLYLSLVLYLLAPVANVYLQVGVQEEYSWNPAAEPFMAVACVVTGWFITQLKSYAWTWAVVLIVMGLIVSWAQEALLVRYYHIYPVYASYGNLLTAAGMLLGALAFPRLGEHSLLPRLGQWTLGVYCSHLLFVDLFKIFKNEINPWVWDFFVPILIYIMAFAFSVCLHKVPFIRRLVV